MSNAELSFKPSPNWQPSPPAEEIVEAFIAERPNIAPRLEEPCDFIGQWSGRYKRATCFIASTLNGVIGLGAISKVEAQQAHNRLGHGDAFGWNLSPQGYYVPASGVWDRKRAFNTLLPRPIELSGIHRSSEIKQAQLAGYIGEAATARIAILLGRSDLDHRVVAVPTGTDMLRVVDSRAPQAPSLQDPEQVAAYLHADPYSDFEMIYDTHIVPLT